MARAQVATWLAPAMLLGNAAGRGPSRPGKFNTEGIIMGASVDIYTKIYIQWLIFMIREFLSIEPTGVACYRAHERCQLSPMRGAAVACAITTRRVNV